MHDAIARVPVPRNEPVLGYAPGSDERRQLKAELARQRGEQLEIPLIIGGKDVTTGDFSRAMMPHAHGHVLAKVHRAGPEQVDSAILAARDGQRAWADMRWEDRARVFLRAAELLAGPWRARLNAATMNNQSKTAHQAEIDSACELIDFWRFNVQYAEQLYAQQPSSAPGTWNNTELRPLEGFVLAVTPFNFTAIAGNLPTAPALMGNAVLWKPSDSATLSGYYLMRLLEEAGLPPGVINFIPGKPRPLVEAAMNSPSFAGLHYTGSTEVFQSLWATAASNLPRYRSYPRIVGETGGKDFILAHPSADLDALAVAILRGGYEYQGQKCSAASRVYVPRSLWARLRDRLVADLDELAMGDVADFRNFMGAVINEAAFTKHEAAITEARASDKADVLAGGTCDRSVGWFVRPTLIQALDPRYRTMREELFGPIVTAYVYDDGTWDDTLRLVDETSPYALTGAVFARDRRAVVHATAALRHAAGNFYINDKPTGAVVGQQPFGGARASGTNDKAGSAMNLLRWTSARTIKETFVPPVDYRYPFMREE